METLDLCAPMLISRKCATNPHTHSYSHAQLLEVKTNAFALHQSGDLFRNHASKLYTNNKVPPKGSNPLHKSTTSPAFTVGDRLIKTG